VAAGHRSQRINQSRQILPPALVRLHEQEVFQRRAFPGAGHAQLSRDDSGVQIVAPRAPGLFFVVARQEVEVTRRQV
jgi:hypothetical protein